MILIDKVFQKFKLLFPIIKEKYFSLKNVNNIYIYIYQSILSYISNFEK